METVNKYRVIFELPTQDKVVEKSVEAGHIKFNSRCRVAFIYRDDDFVALFTNVIAVLPAEKEGG